MHDEGIRTLPQSTPEFWGRARAASLVAGPALVLIPNLMGLNQVGTDASTLAWVRAHEGRYLLGVGILLAGFALLLPAGSRMATALSGRGAALGRIGGALYFVGLVATLATTSTYLLSARLITLRAVDPASALVIKRVGDQDGGVGVFLLVGVLFFAGAVLLVVGLLRGGLIPRWAGAISIVGVLGTMCADIGGAQTPIVVLTLLVWWAGFAAIGAASLSWETVGSPSSSGVTARVAGT